MIGLRRHSLYLLRDPCQRLDLFVGVAGGECVEHLVGERVEPVLGRLERLDRGESAHRRQLLLRNPERAEPLVGHLREET